MKFIKKDRFDLVEAVQPIGMDFPLQEVVVKNVFDLDYVTKDEDGKEERTALSGFICSLSKEKATQVLPTGQVVTLRKSIPDVVLEKDGKVHLNTKKYLFASRKKVLYAEAK